MGCCFSNSSDERFDVQNPIINERTPLMVDSSAVPSRPVFSNDFAPNESLTSPKENDEKGAVNKILHEVSRNVIDIANMESGGIEQIKYSEREKVYSSKVAVLAIKPTSSARNDILSIDSVSVVNVLSEKTTNDRKMITDNIKQVASAFSSMGIKSTKPLVVQFDSVP
ncbi:Ragulator complex protein LAMTOR1 [Trichoplax sp. H2]|uniref:Ragulator complex protein LAMTOR1 n=1 Tax=Trichoplax adhaerens TaxID=10228 RepID=B3RYH8_TRIAD|nr:hypothetical protein TRIADDRAFT_56564 [Trichoplax adhaerens]EDV24599.1 hypothetical protein TRIADDRAFT_56564 [Trichoplax adhaerens]RDD45911.1 Ragulator complex protein LAMTOR1 [Trichoplax sp. H2]|eukprot:XP_002112489.1 hypothetical protein TRIADDRAFT_56564 [Trichoplax adhaerens]